MNENFDIESTKKPVNKNITIVFSPSNNVTSYTYQIYKDSVPIDKVTVSNNQPSNILLTETGTYKIVVQESLLNGLVDTKESGEYIIDKEPPLINISEKELQINKTNDKDLITCTATDNYSGNLTDKISSKLQFTLCVKQYKELLKIAKENVTSPLFIELINELEGYNSSLPELRKNEKLMQKIQHLRNIIK